MNKSDDRKLSLFPLDRVTGWVLFSITDLKYFINTNFEKQELYSV